MIEATLLFLAGVYFDSVGKYKHKWWCWGILALLVLFDILGRIYAE
jgi:hypothetical protein